MYLFTKIADDLFKCSDPCGKDKHSIVKLVAEETIQPLPKRINPSRTISEFAAVGDVLTMMNQHNTMKNF